MPIYEYACRKCNHTLDALQKLSDAPLVECPACGEPELRRLISAPRFRLKGQGWYETDFKKDKQRNLSSADGEPSKDKAGDKPEKSATKTDGAGKESAKPAEASKPAKETKKESKTASD
ncbi:MAG TPA: zinc ribbon domain-containing protein [Woeseiaceae bacterium]|nr:zinc ribbon domain-containing protein [Woeseiaceae bacterium]